MRKGEQLNQGDIVNLGLPIKNYTFWRQEQKVSPKSLTGDLYFIVKMVAISTLSLGKGYQNKARDLS